MNLEEQVAAYDEHAARAATDICLALADQPTIYVELGRSRLISGHELYGDSVWRLSADQLWRERSEEIADAIVYWSVRRHIDRARWKAGNR